MVGNHGYLIEMRRSIRSVRLVVEKLLFLRASLSSAKSTLGDQLDALREGRTGVDDSRYWRKYANANQQTTTFALLVKLWALLTEEEQNVLTLRYAPQVKLNKAGAVIHYRRLVKACDIIETKRADMPPLLATRNGDELVCVADDHPGYCWVDCVEMQNLSTEEIAERINLTARQVRRRLQTAHDKLAGVELFEDVL